MESRRFVLGDIHGGYLALLDVLNKANFNFKKDTLISLGDLCDGWPHTYETIELLKKIDNLILCRGNHDDWMIRYFNKDDFFLKPDYDVWLYHGGEETIKSYIINGELNWDKVNEHLLWLKEKSKAYHIIDNDLFVHAGYNPDYDISEQPIFHGEETFDGISSVYMWDRVFWTNIINKHIHKNCKKYNRIYIGHTPTTRYNSSVPIIIENIVNMDTGAAFYGKLSMMNINSQELIQSDNVYLYYPNYKGRNKTNYH